jgi:hypothetical protein
MNYTAGTRPQVAKLIRDIENISDSDILYKYVEDIASFYTSDCKTEQRILMQYETDIKTLVNYYKYVYIRYVGYEPKTELEKAFQKPIIPDERYKIVVYNIRTTLEFLIQIASSNKIFLPLEKLEELGLKDVKHPKPISVYDLKEPSEEFKNKSIDEYWREFQRINKNARVKREIESVFDSAISFYKAHGFVLDSDLPEIPDKLKRIFRNNKKIYKDFSKECEGKDLIGVAEVYVKYVKNGCIEKTRSMKPIYNYFVSSDDNQYMTFTRYAK